MRHCCYGINVMDPWLLAILCKSMLELRWKLLNILVVKSISKSNPNEYESFSGTLKGVMNAYAGSKFIFSLTQFHYYERQPVGVGDSAQQYQAWLKTKNICGNPRIHYKIE